MEVGGADIQSLIGHLVPDIMETPAAFASFLSHRCQLYEYQTDANRFTTVLEALYSLV